MSDMIGMNPYATAALVVIALWAGGLLAGRANATPASAPRVSVTYADPQNFTENRTFGMQNRINGTRYLEPLKDHLIKRATRMLPPGERLEVTITDIKLAGAYEPWHGASMSHVRIMKDVYPPRIDLTFKLLNADGAVLREGSRTLRDIGFLRSGLTTPGNTDPLRYDKALLNDWLRRGPEGL